MIVAQIKKEGACTRSLIYYTRYNLVLCSNTIPATSGKANKTIYEMAPLAFVLNLELGLFIIYIYLQQVILDKIYGNNWGLNIL